jgi:hypothetical protein
MTKRADSPVPSVGLVVPLFRSVDHIEPLAEYVNQLVREIPGQVSLTLVVDGCEASYNALKPRVDTFDCDVTVVSLSRNFGVGPALRAAMSTQDEDLTIAFGSDLQEPKELFVLFACELQRGEFDFVYGQRRTRDDPFISRTFSRIFWWMNRKLIFHDCPPGGFDVYGCNRVARTALVSMTEQRTNITSQMLWLGFRRNFYPFDRASRVNGKSTWSFRKKCGLFVDSITAFTTRPLALGLLLMTIGFVTSLWIELTNLTSGVLSITAVTALSFGSLLSGPYIIRNLDGNKYRPTFIIRSVEKYAKD